MNSPRVNRLLAELQSVHAMLRHDLDACQELARIVAEGAPAALVREQVSGLTSRSLLFQLKTTCLAHCELVHVHHRGEDVTLFPAVRRSAPHLARMVDRLEEDHRRVSDLLDQVERAARSLDASTDTAAARTRLVAALDALRADLLAHLELEEDVLGPVLAGWTHWPTRG